MDKLIVSAASDAQLHSQLENLLNNDDECVIIPPSQSLATTVASVADNAAANESADVRQCGATAAQPATSTSSRTIEQQILQLRKQLAESHAIFTTARDSLASISFVGIERHIARQSAAALATAAQHFETELLGAEKTDTENEQTNDDGADDDDAAAVDSPNPSSVDPAAQMQFSDDIRLGGAASAVHLTVMKHRVGDVPPLATFFRVVGRLQAGIQRMEQTHCEWAQLNDDLQIAMRLDSEYVANVRRRVDSMAQAGGVTDAERVDLERLVDEAMAKE